MNTTSNETMSRVTRFFPLAIIVGAVLAYANSFSGEFIFDDSIVILTNPKIFHLWPPWEAVLQQTRPLADISFAINYAIGGFNAADYHMTNLLIHLIAGLFLYGVVRRTLLLPRWAGKYDAAAPWLAVAVALLWTVHPLQTESVTYIAQRIEALMGLFYLMTMYFFVRGVTADKPRRWMNASLFTCLLGMGTKEVMVTLPLVLVVYDWIFVASSLRELFRQRWKFYLGLVLTWTILLLLMLYAIAKYDAMGGLMYKGATPLMYALTQLGVIVYYLRLAIVPHPLCFDYAWPVIKSVREVIIPGIIIASIAGLTLWGVVRRNGLAFLGVFFFLILAPTSSIMPMPDAIFEHRMYLPLASVMVLVVLLAYTLGFKLSEHSQARRRLLRTVGLLLMIGITVLFVVLTRARNDDYASEETMWRDMISKNPSNYRTYNGLSSALVNRRAFAESMQVCSNLIARLPDFATMTMAEINQMAGKDPSIRSKKYYYCLAHSNLGAALFHLRRMEEAQVHNIEALRVIPGHTVARSNMAFILYRQNKVDEAIRQWYEALKWDPNELNTHFLLGIVFSEIHKFKPAIYHFRQALRFRPDDSLIQYRLAWLLAGSDDAELRNGAESLAMAKRINQAMEGKSVRALDIMGMAYAETGDFSNAIHSVERALSLASNTPPDLAVSSNSPPMNLSEDAHVVVLTPTEAMTKRLQLYREGKPFRYSKNNSEGFPFW